MSIYIFGYGSLINMSHNKQLVNPSERVIYPVIVNHMERLWNVCGKSQTYLGVLDKNNFKTNGILFKVSEEELLKLIEREIYYDTKLVSSDRISFYKDDILFNTNDKIICFYSKNNNNNNNIICKPINLSYLYLCLEGCLKISKSFTKDFINMITF
jgi:hypothetical protein